MTLPNPSLATRKKSKASIMIQGKPGMGKSGAALLFAIYLAGKQWDRICGFDTENKSLDLFEGLKLNGDIKVEPFTKFDVTENALPSMYLEARDYAKSKGFNVFVADSTSHAWAGEGGILDTVNQLEAANAKVNKFSAWGQPQIMEEKNALKRLWRDPDIHCICTVRLKKKYTMDTDGSVKDLGEVQVMQADEQFEPDLVLNMVKPGSAEECPQVAVVKSRYTCFRLGRVYELNDAILTEFCTYLNEGADPEVVDKNIADSLRISCQDILKSDPAKMIAWKMFVKQAKLDEKTKLADLTLDQLQVLYKKLTNN